MDKWGEKLIVLQNNEMNVYSVLTSYQPINSYTAIDSPVYDTLAGVPPDQVGWVGQNQFEHSSCDAGY